MKFKDKYSGYFNKYILKGAFLICLILIVIAYTINGFSPYSYYSKCENIFGCQNPFYSCESTTPTYLILNNSIVEINKNNQSAKECHKSEVCILKPELCQNTTMRYKQIFASNQSIFIKRIDIICLFIIAIAYIVNHIYYKYKNGKRNKVNK